MKIDLRGDPDRLRRVPFLARVDEPRVQLRRSAASGVAEEPPFDPADQGGVAGDGRRGGVVAAGDDEDLVELVVGGEGGLHVGGADGGREALVGLAHGPDPFGPEQGYAGPGGEFVHHPHHRGGVADDPADGPGDAGVALRLGLDESFLAEPGQGLAHGCAGEPEPVGEVGVLERGSGGEVAAHDGLAQRLVGPVTQQGPAHGP